MEMINLTESVRKIFEMSGVLKLIPETNLDSETEMLINKKEEIAW